MARMGMVTLIGSSSVNAQAAFSTVTRRSPRSPECIKEGYIKVIENPSILGNFEFQFSPKLGG